MCWISLIFEAALDLLRGDNSVADACRRRYHHVLVDEFQDINEVQDEILRHASREAQLGPVPAPISFASAT